MPHLPAFLDAHPHIAVEIDFTHDIVDLAARGIDVAITAQPLDGLPGHVARQLMTFGWITCATPAYLAANGTPQTPADLTRHRIVGYRNQASGQIESWRFAEPGGGTPLRHAPRSHHIFDDGEAAWTMIAQGFGIGWVPEWLAHEGLATGNVVEILSDWHVPGMALHLLRLDNRIVPERVRALLSFIEALPVVRATKLA